MRSIRVPQYFMNKFPEYSGQTLDAYLGKIEESAAGKTITLGGKKMKEPWYGYDKTPIDGSKGTWYDKKTGTVRDFLPNNGREAIFRNIRRLVTMKAKNMTNVQKRESRARYIIHSSKGKVSEQYTWIPDRVIYKSVYTGGFVKFDKAMANSGEMYGVHVGGRWFNKTRGRFASSKEVESKFPGGEISV